jgi:hypothetical protein
VFLQVVAVLAFVVLYFFLLLLRLCAGIRK